MNENATDYQLIFGEAITGYVDFFDIETFLYTMDQFEVQGMYKQVHTDCNEDNDRTRSPVNYCGGVS